MRVLARVERWVLAAGLMLTMVVVAPACGPRQTAKRLEHLLPALGEAELDDSLGKQRWATTLQPGETRACNVEVPRGSRLLFALKMLEGTPGFGLLRFTVRLDSEIVFERQTVAKSRPHWWYVSITFDAQPGTPRVVTVPRPHRFEVSMPLRPGLGLRRLEFRAEHVNRDGEPFPSEPGSPAWIALGSPRLEVPSEPGGSAP